MERDYELLNEIKQRYSRSFPPLLSTGGALTAHRNGMKIVVKPEELKYLEQKGFVETLDFKKSGHQRIRITERGYSILKG